MIKTKRRYKMLLWTSARALDSSWSGGVTGTMAFSSAVWVTGAGGGTGGAGGGGGGGATTTSGVSLSGLLESSTCWVISSKVSDEQLLRKYKWTQINRGNW